MSSTTPRARSTSPSCNDSMISESMRLICKNGPGCKNHDWGRSKGYSSHTRYSHHYSSISQPVGGGFQISFSNTPKRKPYESEIPSHVVRVKKCEHPTPKKVIVRKCVEPAPERIHKSVLVKRCTHPSPMKRVIVKKCVHPPTPTRVIVKKCVHPPQKTVIVKKCIHPTPKIVVVKKCVHPTP